MFFHISEIKNPFNCFILSSRHLNARKLQRLNDEKQLQIINKMVQLTRADLPEPFGPRTTLREGPEESYD